MARKKTSEDAGGSEGTGTEKPGAATQYNLIKTAVGHDIERNRNAALGLIRELRFLVDRVERDLKENRLPTVTCTTLATDLFNRLGRYEALQQVLQILNSESQK